MLIEFFLKLKQAASGVDPGVPHADRSAAEAGRMGAGGGFLLPRPTPAGERQKFFDRFDRVFSAYFKGVIEADELAVEIPEDGSGAWPRSTSPKKRRSLIESWWGWNKLMGRLKKRLEEQKGSHQWRQQMDRHRRTSPFGANGYNPKASASASRSRGTGAR